MLKPFAKIGLSLGIAAAMSIPALATSSAFAAPATTSQSSVVSRTAAPAVANTLGLYRENHPEIRKAIAALERAKSAMQHANHDFGGHRVEALASCDNAIAQLRLALQYDK